MFILNADPHGDYSKILNFCNKLNITSHDTIILLGDVAVNYFGDFRDTPRKEILNNLPCNFFCIHGNHEMRPIHLSNYKLIDYNGGKAWQDPNYQKIIFAKDGEIYNLDGYKCVAIGGAYSVDKPYRLTHGLKWFEDEQPDDEIKNYVEKKLAENNWNVDYVFSHTCPISFEPREVFLKGLDQSKIDKTTEMWLGSIEYKLNYKKWYVGHYHTDKIYGNLRFLFDDFVELGK